MADHVSPPANYDGDWQASPLTEANRHHLHTAIRLLQQGHLDDCELTLDTHLAIESLTLSYAPVDAGLALDVNIEEDALDCDLIANERYDGAGMIRLSDDPHFLRDLGECWYHLEADLITQLRTSLDLPVSAEDLSLYTVSPVGLRCTTAHTGSLACFASIFFARANTNDGDAHQQ